MNQKRISRLVSFLNLCLQLNILIDNVCDIIIKRTAQEVVLANGSPEFNAVHAIVNFSKVSEDLVKVDDKVVVLNIGDLLHHLL